MRQNVAFFIGNRGFDAGWTGFLNDRSQSGDPAEGRSEGPPEGGRRPIAWACTFLGLCLTAAGDRVSYFSNTAKSVSALKSSRKNCH